MNSSRLKSRAAVSAVARALGPERDRVVFVGGTVTAPYSLPDGLDVRPTIDVDCIVVAERRKERELLLDVSQARKAPSEIRLVVELDPPLVPRSHESARDVTMLRRARRTVDGHVRDAAPCLIAKGADDLASLVVVVVALQAPDRFGLSPGRERVPDEALDVAKCRDHFVHALKGDHFAAWDVVQSDGVPGQCCTCEVGGRRCVTERA